MRVFLLSFAAAFVLSACATPDIAIHPRFALVPASDGVPIAVAAGAAAGGNSPNASSGDSGPPNASISLPPGAKQPSSPSGPVPMPSIDTQAGDVQAGYADGHSWIARFDDPAGIAFLPGVRGGLVVADRANHRVRLVTQGPGSGDVLNLAGDGTAGYKDGTGTGAQFDEPTGVAVDEKGVIFVSDPFNHCIRRLGPGEEGKPEVVTTLAGSQQTAGSDDGPPAVARFDTPYAIALDGRGHLFVTERFDQTLRMITLDPVTGLANNVSTVAGLPQQSGSSDGLGAAARFMTPVAIAFNPLVKDHTSLFIAEKDGCRLRQVDVDGAGQGTVTTLNTVVSGCGLEDGPIALSRFDGPLGLAVDPARGLFISDGVNGALRLVSGSPTLVTTPYGAPAAGGSAPSATLNSPKSLAVAPDGSIYVSDGNQIRRIRFP